jgi:hypothetical protein
LSNIISIGNLRRMRLAGHLTCVGKECIEGFGRKTRRNENTRKTKK